MGCGSSKPEEHELPPRPRPGPAAPQQQPSTMKSAVRNQFLRIVHTSLQDIPYMVIGGSALAEYGSRRETADVDVLVGGGYSKRSAEDLLVNRSGGRLVRQGQGKLGYVMPNGDVYQLDLSTDTDVDLSFNLERDTLVRGGARVGTLVFLLNSKARAWQTRVPFEQNFERKRQNDARDISFCLQLLVGHPTIDPKRLKWVYSRHFWTPFTSTYPDFVPLFHRAGIAVNPGAISSESSVGGPSTRSSQVELSPWGSAGSRIPSHTGSRAGSRASSQQGSRDGGPAMSQVGSRQGSRTNSRGSGRSSRR